MIFRQAKSREIDSILDEGYKVWSKGRTRERYLEDNREEDAYGARYIIEESGVIVSSLILLRLKQVCNRETCGIGSVLTPSIHMHRGYATSLITSCLEHITDREGYIFLYSEIAPSFYEKFGFIVLPPALQKSKAPCMVLCGEKAWSELTNLSVDQIPDYF
jgi:predicted acetyltransferase